MAPPIGSFLARGLWQRLRFPVEHPHFICLWISQCSKWSLCCAFAELCRTCSANTGRIRDQSPPAPAKLPRHGTTPLSRDARWLMRPESTWLPTGGCGNINKGVDVPHHNASEPRVRECCFFTFYGIHEVDLTWKVISDVTESHAYWVPSAQYNTRTATCTEP